MHLARIIERSLDENFGAVDLAQSPADIVFLSFADSDLNAFAAAYKQAPEPKPSLRLANLASLKHPFSVDLYLEKTCARARFVVARILGGMDYWRYGVEELSALARAKGIPIAFLPGDGRDDARLSQASTVEQDFADRLRAYFDNGGPKNLAGALAAIAARVEGGDTPPTEADRIAAFGLYERACLKGPKVGGPRALVLFYRSIYLSHDLAPIDALSQSLAARGFSVDSAYATSLKDSTALAPLSELLRARRFDVIVNATAFSARLDDGARALDVADAPVLQVALSGAAESEWQASPRGLSPADLAMNVAMPEVDGRILTRAISFKQAEAFDTKTEFARLAHGPRADRVDFVADLAAAWARLRRTPRAERRLACVFSDYPAKGGRAGYAVGLDTPKSAVAIARLLSDEGYAVDANLEPAALMAALTEGERTPVLTLEDYRRRFAALPQMFQEQVFAAWGPPEDDKALVDGAFALPIRRAGAIVFAVQPDRGRKDARKGEYHDLTLAPRHAYIAFYLWLREGEQIDALIHLGAHGTLEWLPGKAVALSGECAPEVVLGALPVIYPFIVNNPGEAAQAKRRIGAVTIGHLTPPLIEAGSRGPARALEGLFDEYAEAQALDPRRARSLAKRILEEARAAGLLGECGALDGDPGAQLFKLDTWLCDLKDMRIGDGLHVYGEGERDDVAKACAKAERAGLLKALDGRFVEPGPAGAPARGRLDVLPTGRNIFALDPRSLPTRLAYENGRAAAEDLVQRYLKDHGDWPRRIVLDLWGSAAMRTGGEDIAQALALIGARPTWDFSTNRVSGFEILPPALVGRPRVDVTARISGLFRDAFPTQIALLDAAIRAVAALDEPLAENPLAAAMRRDGEISRIFGAAPGCYGVGLGAKIAAGDWQTRQELGRAYLDASAYAYRGEGDATRTADEFSARVASADAFSHMQDLPGQDVLDSDAFAEHEGGFAAAAAMLGVRPALYHVDATSEEKRVVRPLSQEVARALRGRAANPRWIEGQMRHGWRGAMEIADGLDNLFAFAALSDVVESRQFELMFDATLGHEDVRAFLFQANPQAARGMAARFREAERRGFWTARRNSSADVLASLLVEAS